MTSDNRTSGREERITVLLDAELKEIVPGFIEEWKQEVNLMRHAQDRDDYETIRKFGHKIKGSGGICGFDAISDMGGDLEGAVKDMNMDVVNNTLDRLADYLEQIELVYE